MRATIKRLLCPHCGKRRPSYLYGSHIKQCKLAKEAIATIERKRLEISFPA